MANQAHDISFTILILRIQEDNVGDEEQYFQTFFTLPYWLSWAFSMDKNAGAINRMHKVGDQWMRQRQNQQQPLTRQAKH